MEGNEPSRGYVEYTVFVWAEGGGGGGGGGGLKERGSYSNILASERPYRAFTVLPMNLLPSLVVVSAFWAA